MKQSDFWGLFPDDTKRPNTHNHARRASARCVIKTRLCAVYSDVCLARCQRSDQQLLPPYTQRAADRTAHATKPIAVAMATRPTSANQNPSPSISPGNCRSARSCASAHAIHIIFFSFGVARTLLSLLSFHFNV